MLINCINDGKDKCGTECYSETHKKKHTHTHTQKGKKDRMGRDDPFNMFNLLIFVNIDMLTIHILNCYDKIE